MLKNALIFAIAALVIAFSAPSLFPDRAATPGAQATPAPAAHAAEAPTGSGLREASIAADALGQFHTAALIEGQEAEFMVDTGASVVALTAETAARLGVVPDPSAPKWRMTTANGVSFASPVTLRDVSLGAIEMSDVQAVVLAPGAATMNLLGASFLKRLAAAEQRDGVLVLKQ
jgi:aspartyl protease family protein